MDGKIIDARGRFTHSEPGPTQGPAPDPIADERARKSALRRLRQADDAMEQLKNTSRVPHADRPVLARNLGRMVERAFGDDARARLPSVFREAFGEISSESHYKKRKRLIRLGNEPADCTGMSGEYTALGYDFVRMALAIGREMRESAQTLPEERDRAAILRLIEGSSFDNRTGIAQRYEAEQRAELLRRLDQVVARVEAAVDLDAMRAWCQRHAVGASQDEESGELRKVSLLKDSGWGKRLDLIGDGGYEARSRLSPKVQVATIYTRLTLLGALPLKVPSEMISEIGERDAVRAAFARMFEIPAEEFEYMYEWGEWPDGREAVRVQEHEDWIESDGLESDKKIPLPWLAREIDLELRFDPLSDRWRPCLGLDLRRFDPEMWLTGSSVRFGSGEILTACVAEIFDAEHFQSVFVSKDLRGNYFACLVNDDTIPDLPAQLKVGAFPFPSEAAFDLALLRGSALPDNEHMLTSSINSFDDRFSPAPHDTIAGALLRNLAYADAESRIDTMFLRDASARAEKIAALAREVSRGYDAAISGFDRDTQE